MSVLFAVVSAHAFHEIQYHADGLTLSKTDCGGKTSHFLPRKSIDFISSGRKYYFGTLLVGVAVFGVGVYYLVNSGSSATLTLGGVLMGVGAIISLVAIALMLLESLEIRTSGGCVLRSINCDSNVSRLLDWYRESPESPPASMSALAPVPLQAIMLQGGQEMGLPVRNNNFLQANLQANHGPAAAGGLQVQRGIPIGVAPNQNQNQNPNLNYNPSPIATPHQYAPPNSPSQYAPSASSPHPSQRSVDDLAYRANVGVSSPWPSQAQVVPAERERQYDRHVQEIELNLQYNHAAVGGIPPQLPEPLPDGVQLHLEHEQQQHMY